MNKAALYVKVSNQINHDVILVLNEFKNQLRWIKTGGNSLLDVGCGSGNFTSHHLFPLLPQPSGRVVGSDISKMMVEFATNNYARSNHEVQFKVMDIGAQNLGMKEQFNVVTSFYCLHWVKNIRQAFQNMYDLLKPKGDIVLIHLIGGGFYSYLDNMIANPKWSHYMEYKNIYIRPLYEDPAKAVVDYTLLMDQVGFRNVFCEARITNSYFDNVSDFYEFADATNPFDSSIPENLKSNFLNDIFNEMQKLGLVENKNANGETQTTKVLLPKTTLVIYGQKH